MLVIEEEWNFKIKGSRLSLNQYLPSQPTDQTLLNPFQEYPHRAKKSSRVVF
jgi:hypothetical protein